MKKEALFLVDGILRRRGPLRRRLDGLFQVLLTVDIGEELEVLWVFGDEEERRFYELTVDSRVFIRGKIAVVSWKNERTGREGSRLELLAETVEVPSAVSVG